MVGTLYVLAMLALAVVAAWPIYRSGAFLLLVAGTVAVGALLAVVQRRRRPRPLLTAAGLLAAYVALGLTLAMPAWTWGLVPAVRDVAST